MAFCQTCGAEVSGGFCGACGTPVGSAATTPPPAAAGTTAGLDDNVAGALCYVLGIITGVLFLLIEPYSRRPAVRFHAFQSIFFTAALFAFWIAFSLVAATLGAIIPMVGSIVMGALSFVVWLVSVVVWLMLIIKTWGGKKWVLPVIGPLAAKQAG